MDRDHANVMTFENGKEEMTKVEAKLHRNRLKGGARSANAFVRQSSPTERTSLERRKSMQKAYFDELKDLVKGATGIYIFGPAKMKVLFHKTLNEDNNLAERILGVDSADSMTEPQMKAQARKFFEPFFAERANS